MVNIAIDGYVCSGKSTIARKLASRLNFKVLDTGAIYRGFACAFVAMHLDESQICEEYVCKFAQNVDVGVEFVGDVQHVFANGVDYTDGLRTERISALTAKIAPFMCLREKVLHIQRDFAAKNDVVMEGRDIGSEVLPDADFKFLVVADENVRAQRRFQQQLDAGNRVTFEDVLKELKKRDYADTYREHGAIKQMPDSVIVDTTNQSIEESVEFCFNIIKQNAK